MPTKSEVTVLGVVCRRGKNGKYNIFLQVQGLPGAKIGYVKGAISYPPLPGSKISVTGQVNVTTQGPVMTVLSDSDLITVGSEQNAILFDVVKALLERFSIPYNNSKLHSACSKHTLCKLDESGFVSLLSEAEVQNPSGFLFEHSTTILKVLNNALFDGFEKIKLPYQLNTKRTLPFKTDMWPDDVFRGFFPDYMKVTHGQTEHSVTKKKLYITEFIKHEGIDQFFRALAEYNNDPAIFQNWLKDNKRPATIASSYIKDKQKEGVQVFDKNEFKQLERFGIANADKTLSRLGQMYKLPLPGNVLIAQGTYQSNSKIAMLNDLPAKNEPVCDIASIDTNSLDEHQKEAMNAFCQGAPLLLISGSPGTGKSNLLTKMIETASKYGKVATVTLAGKAASRLNISIDDMDMSVPKAQTVHSLFFKNSVFNYSERVHVNMLKPALDSVAVHSFPVRIEKSLYNSSFKIGNNRELKSKRTLLEEISPPAILRDTTLFIDEASQFTSDLFALILEMKPKRIVMVGDFKQIRPVGAGRPFHDLIELAVADYAPDKLRFKELTIDHRASKELSEFTSKLREGELPLSNVISYDQDLDDADTIIDSTYHREGSVIECSNFKESSTLIASLVTKDILKNERKVSFLNSSDKLDHNALNIRLPDNISPRLLSSSCVFPDMMVMASTNEDVNALVPTIRHILRSHNTVDNLINSLPIFSGLSVNDHKPGDILMQTSNGHKYITYSTPQGYRTSSKTMNGEMYVFVGAHVWLPIPKGNTSDIDFYLTNAWEGTGLKEQLLQMDKHDPDAHLTLYLELLKVSSSNVHARNLMSMCLGEVLMLPHQQLKNVAFEKGSEIKCGDSKLVRLPILPDKPFSINNGIINDSGSMALVQNVWKISESKKRSNNSPVSTIDYQTYLTLLEESLKAVDELVSGTASTVHKAQGSQARTSIVVSNKPMNIEDSSNHEELVYTGVTRAEEKAFVILQGTTVPELNKIWKNAREIDESRFSPIKAIADGTIKPICDSLQMTTAYTPHAHKDDKRKDMLNRRKEISLASIGVPMETELFNPGNDLRLKISGNINNSNTIIPGSDKLCLQPSVEKRTELVWSAAKDKQPTESYDAELDSLLSDVLTSDYTTF